MKEAMWGLGLIMLCLLVFVIVGVISNISLTNQQDYYGVKQTTEASAYDSVELVEYKSGVCLCTNTTPNSSGTRVFSSKTEYALKEVDKETNTCPEDPNYSHCDLLLGEYIIDPDVFTESVIARLGSIIKPSEIYDITVQEVIKYPPKVSVNIEFKQALNIEGEDRIHQIIPNKFDGIFEETGESSILTYAQNKLDDWTISCDGVPGQPEETPEETPQETPEETPQETPTQTTVSCPYTHLHLYKANCKDSKGNKKSFSMHYDTTSRYGGWNNSDRNLIVTKAREKCQANNMTYESQNSDGWRWYKITDKKTNAVLCARIEANNGTSAISKCSACTNNKNGCKATCIK